MKAINKTLLDILFSQNPEQLGENGQERMYRLLFNRIFPGKERYIEFLQADTMDQQYDLAKQILRRLCFESNFSPPFSVFQDLVSMENSQKANRSTMGYIPRDHFLHIVYLYMLGIYVFFNDKVFYDNILEQYRFRRDAVVSENMETGKIKDFISAWKYFCIYHDVGYSIEMHANKRWEVPLENITGFIRAFDKGNLQKHTLIEATLKTMTRLVFIRQLIDNADPEIKKNHILRKLSQETVCSRKKKEEVQDKKIQFREVIESVMKKNKELWIDLKKIFSPRCLKVLLSLFDTEDFIILAFNKDNGHPAFCVTPRNGEGHDLHVFDSCKKCEEFQRIWENTEVLFHDDFFSSAFEMKYFLKNDPKKFSIARTGAADPLDAVVKGVKQKFEEDFLKISDANTFYDYQYAIYWNFIEVFSKTSHEASASDTEDLEIGTRLFTAVTSQKAKLKSLDRMIYAISLDAAFRERSVDVSARFFEKLREKTTKKSLFPLSASAGEPYDSITKDINAVKKTLATFIGKKRTFNSMAEDVARTIARDVQKEFLFRQGTYQLFCSIAKQQTGMYNGFAEEFFYNYHPDSKSRNIDASLGGFESNVFQQMPQKFANTGKNLSEIVKNYIPPHDNTQDHGIVSAYCFAYLLDMFHFVIHNKKIEDARLLALMWNIPPRHDIILKKCVTNYGHVIRDVFFSLFIHNLYPAKFEDGELRKYRTGIDEPFVFLALLCDTLQQWNRPHLMHPFDFDKSPNLDATEHYDVLVENDILSVYESSNKDQQRKLRKALDGLSDFLRQPQAFITQGFTKGQYGLHRHPR